MAAATEKKLIDAVCKDYYAGMKYQDIADKHGISLNTFKSWKRRYNWDKKKGAPKKKKGAPINNKNAVGHKGRNNPRNKNAEKHGLFTEYLPEETINIIEQIEQRHPLDILWDQIMIQYAAIYRAQKIMYVTDKEEMIKELKKSKIKSSDRTTEKTTNNTTEEEYEYAFQFSWDRQATFMQAQARAMSSLNGMIKQYVVMCNQGLANEEQQARIEQIKAATAQIKQKQEDEKGAFQVVTHIETIDVEKERQVVIDEND